MSDAKNKFQVLEDMVLREELSEKEAVRIVEMSLFETASRLYEVQSE